MKTIKRIDSPKIAPSDKSYLANAVLVSGGKLLFISGVGPFDSAMNFIGKGDVKTQTEKVIENIKYIVEEAGGTLSDIVKVTVFVKDIKHFEEIAKVREKHFAGANCASTLVEVSNFVDPDMLLEIEAIALIR